MNNLKIEISWGTLWRIVAVLSVVVAAFLVRNVLINLFLAFIISSGINPFIDYLEKKGLPRILGTLFTYLFSLIMIGLIIYAVLPIALMEMDNLLSGIVEFTGNIFNFSSTQDFIKNFNSTFNEISKKIFSSDLSLVNLATSVFGGISFVITVIIVSFYLSISREGPEWFLRAILPENYEDRIMTIFHRSRKRIGHWLQGQIILSFVVGFVAFIGLWLLGVEHSFVLGLTTAVLEIIPFVGPVFAGSIAVLIALHNSFLLALYTVALFVIVQQIEGHIIIPLVMNRTVGLHPVVVLAALMIGFQLWGLIGIVLSVPVAVILQEFLDDWVSIKDSRRAAKNSLP
ncbi:MAG: hypothetical protein A2604_01645 [Candidatus Liptonbacteria bacterium RIFOXYD1_FULL_36_11]|uniref:AI-2E family transporter n=2 Tax=Candidatus Liptoniibacteriota TaxID=1817909 RepID=A0A1G2CQ05_9BACT|nr:MAG: hypothetical protein A2604_01645 [Candidatus Liptonbacteria bacterium RIFOXYD1_FULL_36_11]